MAEVPIGYYREWHTKYLKIFETFENLNAAECRIILQNVFRQFTNDEIMILVQQLLSMPTPESRILFKRCSKS